ncbi:glycoprotein-N-acetylgalactosamine 3-beta-galactosyltransferase 1-like isoform X2 [Anthonomus grandis grandis]|uniref:glycoprotein-N-acetylgalactosamine 3-beta-galactosyltransferase 1-like isoform X2 n=1 Tax=Anthonomus grandis grandis TaxID=2921223 RepID=UPI002165E74A|nr:glycoprotein-N-acetylgalactosamine 3-beta-galactosyltransferase 1-like isoform X2 [Anthonomus grandis grandis]
MIQIYEFNKKGDPIRCRDKKTSSFVSFLKNPTLQTFLVGLFIGIGLSILCMHKTENYSFYSYGPPNNEVSYFKSGTDHSLNDSHHQMIDTELADKIAKKVRVLCWIMTGPANHLTRAIHVKATWGKRCDKLIFMSTVDDPSLPSVALPVIEDRPHLWGKTKRAMQYVYENYYDKYDWFFKADDDTYTVMENLKYLLYYKNASEPVYYGCRLKLAKETEAPMDFMSGGAGYVLSKEALKRFVQEALPNSKVCRQEDTGDEDVEISKCLQGVGVNLGNSLDEEDRNRFTPVFVNYMLIPGIMNEVEWYTRMMYNPYNLGVTCCSDYLITTHYVNPQQMYLLEYLIYHVTPFGRAYKPILHKSAKKPTGIFNSYNHDSSSKEPSWDEYN